MRIIKDWTYLLGVMTALVLGVIGCLPASALAADYTWSGGGGSGAEAWSDSANWVGGVAPSSGASIGTLTFPELSSRLSSKNDLTGVSVERVQADNTHGFGLGGEGFALGSGGLSLSAETVPPIFSTVLAAPMTLTADQTWTMTGPIEPGPAGIPDDVAVTGQLSGENANLSIDLNTYTLLVFGWFFPEPTGPDDEIGNTTITATDVEGGYKTMVWLPFGFNGSDGKRLTVKDVRLEGNGPTGPIVAEGSPVELEGSGIGPVTALDGSSIGINGSVASLSLDASSGMGFSILASGGTPSPKDTQITSTGSINLGGSRLGIGTFEDEAHECPPPPAGQVYPLISTTGSLVGSFSNAPDGSTVVTDECAAFNEHGELTNSRWYSYRINYNTAGSPKTVTATALPAVPTADPEEPGPPTIAGTPTEGQTLSESHGLWTNNPTSYGYQWQRCDTAGNNCQPIAGATAQSYTLASADVGSTIQVQEIASNSEGSSQPAISTTTAVVQAGTSGGSSSGGSTGGDGSSSSGDGSTSSGSAPPIPAAPISPVHTTPKPLTVAQKLARALKACKHDKPKHKRKVCEAKARKRYKVKNTGARK